ncbi:hypothetical protein RB2083_1842 [Rhodobacteraceae bacterium HTCC2083]|nr:hypothetical protein RB2083_1842 [Rhodobacteraceae bacterium HTCC2083]
MAQNDMAFVDFVAVQVCILREDKVYADVDFLCSFVSVSRFVAAVIGRCWAA